MFLLCLSLCLSLLFLFKLFHCDVNLCETVDLQFLFHGFSCLDEMMFHCVSNCVVALFV